MGSSHTATVAEHIQELRSRLLWTVLFLIAGAVLGYFINGYLIQFLQRPLNESLYYTAPGGAFSFIIKVCTVFGLVVALPMLIYQTFSYFGPLIRTKTKFTFLTYVCASLLLAVSGIAFAYFISLPAALHFLMNFGDSSGIQSLITANEYFNFVLTYMAGFAIMFQVPLIVILVDTIKPIPPSGLLKASRYVVLASFILAAILTPTPDPVNQTLMAGPIIMLYFFSIIIVWVRSLLRVKSVSSVDNLSEVPLVARIPEHLLGDTYKRKVLNVDAAEAPIPQVTTATVPNVNPSRSPKALDIVTQPRTGVFDVLRVPKLAE
ncbi:twin-arginine translocase subunit TatC [Candidatus Saccharibacteria bacterium]|nr:twin-arginine translocase subunit TatC [Candidatus Saccharibacteria bacterium]